MRSPHHVTNVHKTDEQYLATELKMIEERTSSHVSRSKAGFRFPIFFCNSILTGGYAPSSLRIQLDVLPWFWLYFCSRNTDFCPLPHYSPYSSYNGVTVNQIWDIMTWKRFHDDVMIWECLTRGSRVVPLHKASNTYLKCFCQFGLNEQNRQVACDFRQLAPYVTWLNCFALFFVCLGIRHRINCADVFLNLNQFLSRLVVDDLRRHDALGESL